MAEEDRTPEPEAERLLARRLLNELGLSPPVDVERVAAEFMDIEYGVFKADCDAVIVGLAGHADRPQLILNADRPPTRLRFTLAHEVGHFRIPWHLGTIVCYATPPEAGDEESYEEDLLHRATEGEANTFASELLLPQPWLAELFEDATSPEDAIAQVRDANVSAAAASYALSDFLPAGHILAVLEPFRIVQYLFRTPGTNVNVAQRGGQLDTASLDALASDHAVIRWGSQSVRWWFFEGTAALLESDDDRTPTEILRGMLDDAVPQDDERERLFRSIQAVTGYAKNVAPDRAPETLHGMLRQRLAQRKWGPELMEHEDFPLWLSRRAEQLSRPRGRK